MSGAYLDPFTVSILDYYGNLVSTSDETITLSIDNKDCSLQGTTVETAVGGLFSFDSLVIICPPPGSTNITVTSEFNPDQLNTAFNTIVIKILVIFRDCMIGEKLVSNQCIECPEGEVLLTWDNQNQCSSCPDDAQCPGGSVIDVEVISNVHNTFISTFTIQRLKFFHIK